MTAWTVVGSGPSGRGLDADDLVGRVLIVNTAGERVPLDLVDVYLFRPQWATFLPIEKARRADVHLVTFDDPRILRNPNPPVGPGSVEFLTATWANPRRFHVPPWRRGLYSPNWDPVGPVAVQYACNHGATSVEVFGFEGDPGASMMLAVQQRELQMVIEECPDVEFAFHGEMQYSIGAPNVRIEL